MIQADAGKRRDKRNRIAGTIDKTSIGADIGIAIFVFVDVGATETRCPQARQLAVRDDRDGLRDTTDRRAA